MCLFLKEGLTLRDYEMCVKNLSAERLMTQGLLILHQHVKWVIFKI
jgi:hypothetical protein